MPVLESVTQHPKMIYVKSIYITKRVSYSKQISILNKISLAEFISFDRIRFKIGDIKELFRSDIFEG